MVLLVEALGLHPGATSADLAARLADPANRDTIAAGVAAQATHFDMLGLQLGYVYADGAVARGDAPPPAPISDPTPFTPDASVGSRLLHGWLADGRSTLDLIVADVMTLLTCGAHAGWAAAVAASSIPVRQVPLGEDAPAGAEWHTLCGLGPESALLVRPDQHIAWRAQGLPTDPAAALTAVLTTILG